jgi:hypothetical protein
VTETAAPSPPKLLELSGKLANKISLRDIGFFGLEAKLHSWPEFPPPGAPGAEKPLRFNVNFADVTWMRDKLVIVATFLVDVQIDLAPTPDKAQQLAQIGAGLRLLYDLDPATFKEADDDVNIEHFVAINGGLHAWPYLRAEVQTLSTKIGLPPLTLPLIRASFFTNLRTVRLSPLRTGSEAPVPAPSA